MPEPSQKKSLILGGIRFDAKGWSSVFFPFRKKPWIRQNELDLSLYARRKRFQYRLEIGSFDGRSLVIRVKGGLANYRKLVQILQWATAATSQLRVRIFAADFLDFAAFDKTEFHEEKNLSAYHLEKRIRLNLLALEWEFALEDAQEMLERFPRWEQKARRLRLKALLLQGDLRAARAEIKDIKTESGVVDPEALAEFAIIALYRGRGEGVSIARELIEDGSVECIESVGIEFSRYLADRSRFKEALKVLQSAENRTQLNDPNLYRSLIIARGEVMNKRDYRLYRYFGYMTKSWFRWTAMGLVYLLLILYNVGPEVSGWRKDWLGLQELRFKGYRGQISYPSIEEVRVKRGVSIVKYTFKAAGDDPVNEGITFFGKTHLFTSEAHEIFSTMDGVEVIYLSNSPERNLIGPVSESRLFARWYQEFGKATELGMIFGSAGVFLVVGFSRRLIR